MKKNLGLVIGFIGVIFCLIGSILPWVEYSSSLLGDISVSGLEGDGSITLMLSIVVLILLVYGIFAQQVKQIRIIGVINLVLCILIGVIAMNVSLKLTDAYIEYLVTGEGMHSGSGLMFVPIGAFLLFISCICLFVAEAENKSEIKKDKDRYCPDCGRGIPFDAIVCPYCGKKFKGGSIPITEDEKTKILVDAIKEDKKWKEAK